MYYRRYHTYIRVHYIHVYLVAHGALSNLRAVKKEHFGPPPPLRRSCRLNRVLHSFVRKVAQKMRGQAPHLEPTFMAIGKILELSDKI